jgi:hypothetical protein
VFSYAHVVTCCNFIILRWHVFFLDFLAMFFHPWRCLDVFLLLTKHRSPWTENRLMKTDFHASQIQSFPRDIQISRHLVGQCPILGCFFKTLS